ncbi:hypothetical protein [Mitsuokella sp. WILCCON 0060]|uniref:hypothetical protein n=1 Tax=Mitsuokella sp. WILCCON 0060 TaxID=3345341 RepID=UPI003F1B5081
MDLKELHQQHQYEEICSCWEQHKSTDEEQPWPEWNYVFAMNALYKLKRYSDCLDLYREFHKAYPQSNLINDRMGWAVYHVCLKGHDFKKGDNGRYLKQVDYVLHHCEPGPYSPVALVVGQAVKAILSGSLGSKIDYQRANDYLDLLDPKSLSQEARIFQQEDGKTRKLSSQQEKWYASKCKVLLHLKRYDDCVACCDQALSVIDHFHSNNDVWLRRLKIEALLQLGRVADAKGTFEQMLTSPFHPWVLYELGYYIAVAEKNPASALKYIGTCALADQSHEMRVKFYEVSSDFLYQHGFEHMAMLQAHLVDLIRQEKEWKAQVHRHKWQIAEDVTALDKKATLKELRAFWQEQRDKDKVFLEGTVKTVLPSGRNGFIKSQTGPDYFFSFADVKSGRQQIKEGTPVRFTLVKRLDRKKNRLSDNAVEITVQK